MTSTNSALQGLVAWASGAADDSRHRRIAARWAAARPAMAGYTSVGDVVRAGWADLNVAAVMLAELTVVGAGHAVGVQAALAILAPRLSRVVARIGRHPRRDLGHRRIFRLTAKSALEGSSTDVLDPTSTRQTTSCQTLRRTP